MPIKEADLKEGDFLKVSGVIYEVVNTPKEGAVECVNFEKAGYRVEHIEYNRKEVVKATREDRASVISKKVEVHVKKLKKEAKEILRLKEVKKDFMKHKSDHDMVKSRLEILISGKKSKGGKGITPEDEEEAVLEIMDEYFKDTTGLLTV